MVRTSRHTFLASLLICGLAASCNSSGDDPTPAGPVMGGGGGGGTANATDSLDEIDLDADVDGDRIVDLPDTADAVFSDLFTRYTAHECDLGRIHILAQSSVSNDRIERARAILTQQIESVPGTTEGGSKEDVIAAMVNLGATLALFDNVSSANPALPAVGAFLIATNGNAAPLPADRIVLEGTPAYMATLPAEDNTFGATGALIYRSGLVPARAAYAAEIGSMRQAALTSGDYTEPAELAALSDLDRDSAFAGLLLDVHSGIWGHDPNGDGSAGSASTLAFGSREDLAAGMPAALNWVERFFATGHTFDVALPEAFTGNFDGLRRNSNPYTSRSQHLRNIRLTGTNSAEIFGAPFDSTLIGNVANNNLKGRAGDDILIGGDGFDTAVFSGPAANYTITMDGADLIVEDVLGGHDGVDRLTGFERLQFTDGGQNL